MKNFTGEYQHKNSILHKTNAIVKLCGFIVLITLTIVFANVLPLYLARAIGFLCLYIIAFVLAKMALISFKEILMPMKRMSWFFVVMFIMNFCFSGDEKAWFKLWIFTPSLNGLISAINIVLIIIVVLIFGIILNSTTKPLELTKGIETLLTPLKYIKIPTQLIALILSVSISFIPTIFRESDTIKNAQMARGARYDSKNIFKRAKTVLPLAVAIFLAAFRRADELSLAMEARGYKD